MSLESWRPSSHPRDKAHRVLNDPGIVGLKGIAGPRYVEPDFVQRFPYRVPRETLEGLEASAPCQYQGGDSYWPPAAFQFAWQSGG